mmetsp:Transcript_60857/g.178533  ORF Transcript_60857/g.178533 Transcript_60857/m.178533 type:complete len:420 (+) Transcript_60857:524-1783(+)
MGRREGADAADEVPVGAPLRQGPPAAGRPVGVQGDPPGRRGRLPWHGHREWKGPLRLRAVRLQPLSEVLRLHAGAAAPRRQGRQAEQDRRGHGGQGRDAAPAHRLLRRVPGPRVVQQAHVHQAHLRLDHPAHAVQRGDDIHPEQLPDEFRGALPSHGLRQPRLGRLLPEHPAQPRVRIHRLDGRSHREDVPRPVRRVRREGRPLQPQRPAAGELVLAGRLRVQPGQWRRRVRADQALEPGAVRHHPKPAASLAQEGQEASQRPHHQCWGQGVVRRQPHRQAELPVLAGRPRLPRGSSRGCGRRAEPPGEVDGRVPGPRAQGPASGLGAARDVRGEPPRGRALQGGLWHQCRPPLPPQQRRAASRAPAPVRGGAPRGRPRASEVRRRHGGRRAGLRHLHRVLRGALLRTVCAGAAPLSEP